MLYYIIILYYYIIILYYYIIMLYYIIILYYYSSQHLYNTNLNPIYPTPPLGQDMTQGQFLSRV